MKKSICESSLTLTYLSLDSIGVDCNLFFILCIHKLSSKLKHTSIQLVSANRASVKLTHRQGMLQKKTTKKLNR